MYQDFITRPSTANSPKPLSIDLSSIQLDERVAFVNSVCAALIDSRFGTGSSKPIFINVRKLPEREPAVFCELAVAGRVPCYEVSPDTEMARPYMMDVIRRELARAGLIAGSLRGQSRSPSTLGRGSPRISQRRIGAFQYHPRQWVVEH